MNKQFPAKPASPDESRLVMLGTISKPQGLKGGVRMWPEFDDREDFEELKTDRLFLKLGGTAGPGAGLKPKPPAWYEITLDEYSEHQRFLVLFFESVTDPETAELLRGAEVYVYEDEMWDLPEGQFYAFQLVGMEVFDEMAGAVAGTVKEFRSSVQDYLLIAAPGKKDFLVPYVPEVVVKVDVESGRITARIPEGLDEL